MNEPRDKFYWRWAMWGTVLGIGAALWRIADQLTYIAAAHY